MTTKQLTETISFAQIVEYAIAHAKTNINCFPIISYEPRQKAVILNFTLFGDYVGSTIEKSNYYFLQGLIKELYYYNYSLSEEYEEDSIFAINESYHRYCGDFSSVALAIVGDLPVLDWEVITEAVEASESYYLLNEDHHYEAIQILDVWESWTSWQYYDLAKTLKDRGINLDSEEFHTLYEQENCDRYSWLWNILFDPEVIPEYEDIEITEINATAYYDFKFSDNDLIDRLVEYINNIF